MEKRKVAIGMPTMVLALLLAVVLAGGGVFISMSRAHRGLYGGQALVDATASGRSGRAIASAPGCLGASDPSCTGAVAFQPGRGAAGDQPLPGDDYPAKWRAPVPQDSRVDSWGEYNRECTSWAAWALHSRNGFEMPFHDMAYNWGARARSLGYPVDSTPAVGAVAWVPTGHVAWVYSVDSDHVVIQEYNWYLSDGNTDGLYHWRSVPTSSFQYIHFEDLSTPGVNASYGKSEVQATAGAKNKADQPLPAATAPGGPILQGSNGSVLQGSNGSVLQGSNGSVLQGSNGSVLQGSNGSVLQGGGRAIGKGATKGGAGAGSAAPPQTRRLAGPATTAPPTPAPAPIDKTAIVSYDEMRGGAPYWGTSRLGWQAFVAKSNTITEIGVTWSNPADAPGQMVPDVTTRISLCTGVDATNTVDPCAGRIGDDTAAVRNQGESTGTFNDHVDPGTTYYVVYYAPTIQSGQWDLYWWSCPTCSTHGRNDVGKSDENQVVVRGYDR